MIVIQDDNKGEHFQIPGFKNININVPSTSRFFFKYALKNNSKPFKDWAVGSMALLV